VGVPKKNPAGFFGYVPGCLNPGCRGTCSRKISSS